MLSRQDVVVHVKRCVGQLKCGLIKAGKVLIFQLLFNWWCLQIMGLVASGTGDRPGECDRMLLWLGYTEKIARSISDVSSEMRSFVGIIICRLGSVPIT